MIAIPSVSVFTACAQAEADVSLSPAQDIAAIVKQAPEGTRFHFAPGVYRGHTLRPKDRQAFIGQDGVVLSGAMELANWIEEDGVWRSQDGLPPPLPSEPACAEGRDLCHLREDLFVDDRLYRRVGSLDELEPGTWFYGDGRAHLVDDPTRRLVELSVVPLAIGSDAVDVLLQDLTVEKYAPLAQQAAIESVNGRGWTLIGVSARWNHAAGLFFGPETRVTGGAYSHNGQLGIKGTGENVIIEGVEIAHNNYAGYSARWEAGGTKFFRTQGLVVRHACVHDNDGPGLWTDIDNLGVLYEGNRVFANANDGIKHEVSYDAVIRDNVVMRNGFGHDVWLWGSQILIQNSRDVEVAGNLVEVAADYGHGVGIVHQERGDGAHGPWRAHGNRVHGNTIVHLGRQGQSGAVMDTDEDGFWENADNLFDRNVYVTPDGREDHWQSDGRSRGWRAFRELGHERHGELIAESREGKRLACVSSERQASN